MEKSYQLKRYLSQKNDLIFLFLIFISIFFQIFKYQSGFFSFFYYLPLLTFCYYVFVQLIGLEKYNNNKILTSLYFVFSFWIFLGVISCFWAIDSFAGFMAVRQRLFYFLNFYVITQFFIDKKRYTFFKIVLYFAIFISIIHAFYEVFSLSHLPTSSKFNKLSFTPTGTFYNPNDFSSVLLILIPFIFFEKKTILKYLSALIMTLILIIFGLTGTRFAIIIFTPFYLYYLLFKSPRFFLTGVLVILLTIPILFNYLPPIIKQTSKKYIITNILSFNKESVSNRTGSISIRKSLIKQYFGRFIESKGLGVGAGNIAEIPIPEEYIETGNVYFVHNYFIEVLVNDGILGFICFMIIIFTNLVNVCINLKNKFLKKQNLTILLFLLFFSVSIMIPSSICQLFVYWIGVGMVYSIQINNLLIENNNQ